MITKFITALAVLIATLPAHAFLNDVGKTQVWNKNLLVNGGFENGKAKWTASGGTFTTTTSSPMIGKVHATWDSSSASQTLTSTAVAIPAGMLGRNGAASCLITVASGSATHTLEAYDGTNILASASITSNTAPTRTSVNFIFPSSGSISLRLVSVAADEPSIAIDDCYVGPAEGYNISSVSQATFVGGMENAGAASCIYSQNSSSGISNFVDLGTGTSCAAWTVVSNGPGTISAQGTNDHRLVYTNMPPGHYKFELDGIFIKGGAATGACSWRLSDGTNTYQAQGTGNNAAQEHYTPGLNFHVTVITAQTKTYTLQAADSISSGGCQWFNNANYPASWKVYRFPTTQEQAYTADVVNWRVDANISGANISLGSSARTAYVTPNNASLTLTQNSGSASVGISCSSTNDNTVGSTTCSAGSEEPGIVVNVPRAGTVEVCYDFSHLVSHSSSSTIFATFQAVRTANGSQTIAEEGKARVYSGASTSAAGFTHPLPHKVCGQFNVPSAGKHTFRLMYEMPAATITTHTIVADADANNGQRDIHVTAKYIDQSFPAPNILNQVTTPVSGGVRVASAYVTTAGAVSLEDGDWISGNCAMSGTNSSLATCTLVAGTFSATPKCVISPLACPTEAGGCGTNLYIASISSSSIAVRGIDNANANYAAANFNIICIGPK